jgi:hypothetical protein
MNHKALAPEITSKRFDQVLLAIMDSEVLGRVRRMAGTSEGFGTRRDFEH